TMSPLRASYYCRRLCPALRLPTVVLSMFFFFNDTATTEIYTLSLHDALPICAPPRALRHWPLVRRLVRCGRSEEHTSELQSHLNLVWRLLLEKTNQHTGT